MERLSEVFNYLNSLDNEKIITQLDEFGEKLMEKDGQNSDLQYKNHIRTLDNFKEMVDFHFRNRFLKKLEGKPPETEEYLSVKQISKELKTSEVTVRKYIKLGHLQVTEFGEMGKRKSLRVKRSDLKKFMER